MMKKLGFIFLLVGLFSCTENNADIASANQKASVVFSADKYNELMSSDKPLYIDFNAKWCGPCKLMKPMFEELAIQYQGKVNFISIDTDKNPEIADQYGVTSIPTFVLVHNKVVQWGSEGSLPKEMLEEPLKKYK
jgi:thioredoxin 1